LVASLFGAGRPLILGAQVGYSSGENVPWGAPAARLSSSRRVSFLLFQSANAALVARRAFGLALALALGLALALARWLWLWLWLGCEEQLRRMS